MKGPANPVAAFKGVADLVAAFDGAVAHCVALKGATDPRAVLPAVEIRACNELESFGGRAT